MTALSFHLSWRKSEIKSMLINAALCYHLRPTVPGKRLLMRTNVSCIDRVPKFHTFSILGSNCRNKRTEFVARVSVKHIIWSFVWLNFHCYHNNVRTYVNSQVSFLVKRIFEACLVTFSLLSQQCHILREFAGSVFGQTHILKID